MESMAEQRKAKKRENHKVVVRGTVAASNPHSIKILCAGDSKERWFNRSNCSPRHSSKIGEEVTATTPIDTLKNDNGSLPNWVNGKNRSKPTKKIDFKSRIEASGLG